MCTEVMIMSSVFKKTSYAMTRLAKYVFFPDVYLSSIAMKLNNESYTHLMLA